MQAKTAAPSLEDKVAFLSDTASYPYERGDVEVVETHMSWVFLTAKRVYKLKKPIRRELIDFTNVDARYANCREEVRLNRRLGGDTYLGVEALSLGPDGELSLGQNGGTAVDWLVVMRHLPRAAMLENQIREDRLDESALRAVAKKLAHFYRDCESVDLGIGPYLERLRDAIQREHRLLARYDLPEETLTALRQQQLALLEHRPGLFTERVTAGMILEAHGDLRPEHVCLSDPPVIIDCLEFSRDLRIQDRMDELSFLTMEAEKLGSTRVGEILLQVYSAETGDRPNPALLAFYRSRRALLRARLSATHLEDDPEQRRGDWLGKARDYLAIAERDIQRAC